MLFGCFYLESCDDIWGVDIIIGENDYYFNLEIESEDDI